MYLDRRFSLRYIKYVIVVVMLVLCFISVSIADDDEHDHKHRRLKSFSGSFHEIKNEGDETSGVIAAVALAVANIPVFMSLLLKMFMGFFPLSDDVKNKVKRLNVAQKKYLMPVHYYLNLFAIIPVLIHFSLSSCRASFLPEAGMISMIVIASAGAILKFRVSPKIFSKSLYRMHTSPWAASILIVVLLVGHGLVD